MGRNGHEIGPGVADRLVLVHPQQTHKHLLHAIRHVRRIAHARSHIPTEALAVLASGLRNERLSVIRFQGGSAAGLGSLQKEVSRG